MNFDVSLNQRDTTVVTQPSLRTFGNQTDIQHIVHRQFIELQIATHLAQVDREIQLSHDLIYDERIKVCQEHLQTKTLVVNVIAAIFTIRLSGGKRSRDEGSLSMFCLFNEKLSKDIQQQIQARHHIPKELMKGVKDTCHLIFGANRRYLINFFKDCGNGRILTIHGDTHDDPVVWDLNSKQIQELNNLSLNHESILSKCGNVPVICSIFGASQVRYEYIKPQEQFFHANFEK